MQILTPEAAQAEILNKDFTSSETMLPLPSIDQSLQHLLQQAFWWWTIQSLPWSKKFDVTDYQNLYYLWGWLLPHECEAFSSLP